MASAVLRLESDIAADVKNINQLEELLDYLDTSKHKTKVATAALHAARRLFVSLIDAGRFHVGSASSTSPKRALADWLRVQFRRFSSLAALLLHNRDPHVQAGALRTLMLFVKMDAQISGAAPPDAETEASKSSKGPVKRARVGEHEDAGASQTQFGVAVLSLVVRALLGAQPLDSALLKVFREEFLRPFADVRYFTMRAVEGACKERWQALSEERAEAKKGADKAKAKKQGKRSKRETVDDAESGDHSKSAAGEGSDEADGTVDAALLRAPADVVAQNAVTLLEMVEVPTEDEELPLSMYVLQRQPEGGSSGGSGGDAKRRRKRRAARFASAAGAEGDSDEEGAAEKGDERPAAEVHRIGGPDWDSDEEAAEEARKERQRSAMAASASAGTARAAAAADYDPESALFAHGSATRALQAKVGSASRRVAASRRSQGPWTASGHRRAFTGAWLAALRLPMLEETYKRVLLGVHDRLLPRMTTPLMLATFLTAAYDQGGVVALLALDGLFVLMTEHNLDYPDFYPHLYRLLSPQLLHAKHRARFFRLFALFLSSTHLPSYLIAAFVKKLSRLLLFAPPPAAVFVLPCLYNLLLAHADCLPLVRRTQDERRKQALLARVSRSAEDVERERERAEAAELQGMGVDVDALDRRARALQSVVPGESAGQVLEELMPEGEEDDVTAGAPGAASEEAAGEKATAAPEAAAAAAAGKEGEQAGAPPPRSIVARALELKAAREAEKKEREAALARRLEAQAEMAVFKGEDPFMEDEPDPRKCRALESTLWEVATLKNHYNPTVATLAGVLEEAMDRQAYKLEDFMSYTYSSMIGDELKRRIKGTVALEAFEPRRLFGSLAEDRAFADRKARRAAGEDVPLPAAGEEEEEEDPIFDFSC